MSEAPHRNHVATTLPTGQPQLVADGPLNVVQAEGHLKVKARFRNQGQREVYLFDRLWSLSDSYKVVADPAKAYRFVENGTLRLVLGWAPLPRDRSVAVHMDPHAMRVESGGTAIVELSLELPVNEYNVYFDDPGTARYQPGKVGTVELIAEYVIADPGLLIEESKLFPDAFQVRGSKLRDMIQKVRSSSIIQEVEVLSRSDRFERYPSP